LCGGIAFPVGSRSLGSVHPTLNRAPYTLSLSLCPGFLIWLPERLRPKPAFPNTSEAVGISDKYAASRSFTHEGLNCNSPRPSQRADHPDGVDLGLKSHPDHSRQCRCRKSQ
jgi:hypothetical protein